MRTFLVVLLFHLLLAGCASAPQRVEPLSAQAHNAAGMRFSAAGRHDEAIAAFRAAIAIEPQRAHLYNNLGYAHLVRGETTQAIQAFEQALRVDPQHATARQNLALARPRNVVPAIAQPMAAASKPLDPRLVPVAPHVYELRDERRAVPLTPRPMRKPKLDVVNGNGIPGLARRVSARLMEHGIVAARLGNKPPYKEAATVLLYRAGAEAEALQLAALLALHVRAVPSRAMPAGIDLRLVIGRDAMNVARVFREATLARAD